MTRPVWAEVDLAAIRHNAAAVSAAAGVPLMAVVKADAYGHGAVPVARAALDGGAVALGVALVEEAEELRAAGIDAPVLLLSQPPPDAAGDVVRLRLWATVYSERFAEALSAAAESAVQPIPVHVKVDTGMHRVGADPDDAVALVRRVDRSPRLRLAGVWTHLAVAEIEGHRATQEQLSVFDAVIDRIRSEGVDPGTIHAANSAAALAVPEARRDLVRVGISLYGVKPSPCLDLAVDLRPAMRLSARIAFVKELPAGATLSYGLSYALPAAGRVATVPVGYADGYSRLLSNKAHAVVRGTRVPVAGTVTMDQILLDCGSLPVEEGDEVELLGPGVPADELARHQGTIAYEVLTSIGKRVPRVYIGQT